MTYDVTAPPLLSKTRKFCSSLTGSLIGFEEANEETRNEHNTMSYECTRILLNDTIGMTILYLTEATPESGVWHHLAQLVEGVVQQTHADALPLRGAFVIAHALASSRRAAPR